MGRGGVGGLIPLGEATRTWFAISVQTFGGPAGQIAVMQHALVDQKRWVGQKRFLHALSFCTLLPGPEASPDPVSILEQGQSLLTGRVLHGGVDQRDLALDDVRRMTGRALKHGGSFWMRSTPGQGRTLTWSVPVSSGQ